ncbi:hypothetical protein, partial [uncultured Oscillibacter sp.]|uniref:hypothetical protein n=1 Tax=uncultured Oscillibacter sp. TaxID=876091 RepID=UPI002639D925
IVVPQRIQRKIDFTHLLHKTAVSERKRRFFLIFGRFCDGVYQLVLILTTASAADRENAALREALPRRAAVCA